jgi:hypothetical protein
MISQKNQLFDRLCGLVVRVPGYKSRGRVRFPALPDFLRSSGSGTGSTQTHKYNWGIKYNKITIPHSQPNSMCIYCTRSYSWYMRNRMHSPTIIITIEELLGRNSSGSGLESPEYGRGDPLHWPNNTLYPQKLALTSLTSGGHSVGIVCSWIKDTEFSFLFLPVDSLSFSPLHY